MLLCHVHVCVELHGNFLLYLQSDVCNCLKQRAFYVLAIKQADGYCIRYSDRGSRDAQTSRQQIFLCPG